MSPKRLSIAVSGFLAALLLVLGFVVPTGASSSNGLSSYASLAQANSQYHKMVHSEVNQSSAVILPKVSPAKLMQEYGTKPLPAKPVLNKYKVREGDTLSKIASKFDIKHWERLYCENKKVIGNNPGLITPGMRLLIGQGKNCKIPAPPAIVSVTVSQPVQTTQSNPAPSSPQPTGSGIYSYSQLESLWESAGGPNWAAPQAAQIAECESGGNPQAYNPSGATGLWQILGQVVAGNLYDPMVNALNAVFKFHESGDTFAQWVCQ